MQFPFALSLVEGQMKVLSGYSASQIFCRLTFRLRSLPDLLPIGQLLVFKNNPIIHCRVCFRPIGLAHQ